MAVVATAFIAVEESVYRGFAIPRLGKSTVRLGRCCFLPCSLPCCIGGMVPSPSYLLFCWAPFRPPVSLAREPAGGDGIARGGECFDVDDVIILGIQPGP